MSAENALVTLLVEKLKTNMLILPTLPEIAVRVRQAAEDPEINLNSMAEVISRDPALTARMIKVANSAFLGRSIKVSTLQQAVTRIGLFQVKNIATAMALEQLFVSHNAVVAEKMSSLWQDTIEITCIAMACLRFYLQTHKHCNLNLDTLTLAALVHRIGVLPILTEAEKHPRVFAEPHFLNHAITDFSSDIGVAIIDAWCFDDMFKSVVSQWGTADVSPLPGYTDFVRLGLMARQHYPDRLHQAELLTLYCNLGLIPDADFMQDPAIIQWYSDAKSMFL